MAHLALCIFALLTLLTTRAVADITVHSSFLFLRTGDRTPLTLTSTTPTLSPLGAQQLYSVGEFFRARYITNALSLGNSSSALNTATIANLSVHQVVNAQLYLLALDQPYSVASATAFLQGIYPPFSIMTDGNGGNLGEGDGVLSGGALAGLGLLGNQSYIESPLSGYQYPFLRVPSARDYMSIYTSGSRNCPALDLSIMDQYNDTPYQAIAASTSDLYEAIADAFMSDVAPEASLNYYNAYSVYDYMSYLYSHNTSVYQAFTDTGSTWSAPNASYSDLDRLRWLADSQMTTFLGDLTSDNPYARTFAAATKGSISTIAGATLTAKVMTQFERNIQAAGTTSKLNVLVGDFDAFVSFFALAGLPRHNSNFLGLPAYGSAMVFELFSYTNSSASAAAAAAAAASTDYPDRDELWVRFLFRNGTDNSTWTTGDATDLGGLQAYPLFGRGPSATYMSLAEFEQSMVDVAIQGPADWCQMCGAKTSFCAPWNSSLLAAASSTGEPGAGATGATHGMHPVVAGFVGAVVAIAIMALAGVVLVFGGTRIRRLRNASSRGGVDHGTVGGFKGRRKLGSDADLTLPKSGAFVGAAVERRLSDNDGQAAMGSFPDPDAKERVGSWEMKGSDMQIGRIGFGASVESLDPSAKPVRPAERV